VDINKPGSPGTVQRVVYLAARATTPEEWSALNEQAHDALEKNPEDLLLNGLCAATHKIVTMQSRIKAALRP